MYFFNCERMDTARDIARKESAWDRHQDDDFPYFINALYADQEVSFISVHWGGSETTV